MLSTEAILLAAKWPFRRSAVVRLLQEAFSGSVQIGDFRSVFFPYPGFVAQRVAVRRSGAKSGTPLVAVDSMSVRSRYWRLLRFSKNLAEIHVAGMKINIPRKGQQESAAASRQSSPQPRASASQGGSGISGMSADVFEASHATVAFEGAGQGGEPYVIAVDRIRLNGVRAGQPFSYETVLRLPAPPGTVRAHGHFGPWNRSDPFQTPVSGTYVLDRANLAFAQGIAGILGSRGQFRGPLRRIAISGSVEVPGFEVVSAQNPERLAAKFQAVVNGQTGSVSLSSLNTGLRDTDIRAGGEIADDIRGPGKAVSVNLAVAGGHIEDLLHLFIAGNSPGMTGIVDLQTNALLPPGNSPFLKKLTMHCGFRIRDARFTSLSTENSLDRISERATGKKGNEPDPPQAPSSLSGDVVLRGEIATFTHLRFAMPGVFATLHGTYNLSSGYADLHGTAHLDTGLAKTQKGLHAFFVRFLDVFLKHNRSGGNDVPIRITGANGHFSLALDM